MGANFLTVVFALPAVVDANLLVLRGAPPEDAAAEAYRQELLSYVGLHVSVSSLKRRRKRGQPHEAARRRAGVEKAKQALLGLFAVLTGRLWDRPSSQWFATYCISTTIVCLDCLAYVVSLPELYILGGYMSSSCGRTLVGANHRAHILFPQFSSVGLSRNLAWCTIAATPPAATGTNERPPSSRWSALSAACCSRRSSVQPVSQPDPSRCKTSSCVFASGIGHQAVSCK